MMCFDGDHCFQFCNLWFCQAGWWSYFNSIKGTWATGKLYLKLFAGEKHLQSMKAQIHIVKEQPSLFWMNVTAKALYLNNTGKEIDIIEPAVTPFEVLASSCIHSL